MLATKLITTSNKERTGTEWNRNKNRKTAELLYGHCTKNKRSCEVNICWGIMLTLYILYLIYATGLTKQTR